MIGIYKITSPSNKIYIGQSVNIEERFKQYKHLKCKGQTILYRSFLKYGVNEHILVILLKIKIGFMEYKNLIGGSISDKISIYNCDCMELLRQTPDNYYSLALVDPPYGLMDKLVNGGAGRNGKFDKNKDSVKWDILPTKEYFIELMRVSENQIIWGSNYFDLPPTRCNIIWDKMQEFTGSDFELAWTSFDKASKAFRMSRVEAYSQGKIHPTQKPVALYKWLLDKYAKQGDKILDTHLGSMSIAIACADYGFDLYGCELDPEYYKKGLERVQNHMAQTKLF